MCMHTPRDAGDLEAPLPQCGLHRRVLRHRGGCILEQILNSEGVGDLGRDSDGADLDRRRMLDTGSERWALGQRSQRDPAGGTGDGSEIAHDRARRRARPHRMGDEKWRVASMRVADARPGAVKFP